MLRVGGGACDEPMDHRAQQRLKTILVEPRVFWIEARPEPCVPDVNVGARESSERVKQSRIRLEKARVTVKAMGLKEGVTRRRTHARGTGDNS